MIPKQVTELAQERIETGGKIVKLGTIDGWDIFTCEYDEPATVGYPELYLWNGRDAKIATGENALTLISVFERD